MLSVNRIGAMVACVAALVGTDPACAETRVVSINLCTDQLLLSLARPEQILSLSWLASDPEESVLAAEARTYPFNYGTAEEVLALGPDLVLAGSYTSTFTRSVLKRLGFHVHEIEPAQRIEDIEQNLREVAGLIEAEQRAEALIREFRGRLARLAAPEDTRRVAFLRPGGFTIERASLANALIERVGIRNVAAEDGLDRWGSLPMETLVRASPDVIAILSYQSTTPSLANSILDHPALRAAVATRTVHVPTRYWACGLPQSLDAVELLLDALASTRVDE